VGHLAGGVLARRRRRLPEAHLDKRTGVIDKSVAEYWREHYDLSHILRRDWDKGLGKKLEGKIHIYVGDMDNYYLNNAVYLVEEFLERTKDPYYAGEVDYGDRAEHCWNGDHSRPNAYSRLRYHQMFAPKIVERDPEERPAGGGPEELAVLKGSPVPQHLRRRQPKRCATRSTRCRQWRVGPRSGEVRRASTDFPSCARE